jgi:hypothetical protein
LMRPAGQGACLFALLSMASPVLEISWPAPAMVWQAPRSGAAPKSTSRVRVNIVVLLHMAITYG